ncbi:unnamed protein product, partial [Staurois parvus]
GTDWRHCWALTGGTAGHRWVVLLGTGGWHCWAQVSGPAGHRWVALLGTDHHGTDHQCPELPVLGSTFLTL